MHDIMMKNRLLARVDFSNALSELCSRYNDEKSLACNAMVWRE